MKGLLIALGKPKGGPSKAEEAAEGEDGSGGDSPEKSFAREAFSALKEDDEDGFVESLLGAIRACAEKDY